ncbi:hypothetical protein BJF93_07700 [Xaviernesmea oryzae]|uniref:Anti-sigma factor n=1 Tax=Xaviernesmea oryzae TaxID=464029 RepID=A0A1Q9B1V6_9HYPH|nr:anti-sigma factor [Xaviernesmea oryzae]OLP61997.1 hypothetical protein BJF93_07700 [Xaviernesmea oryzae]SEK97735.1 Transmembrane transcriptional regulator (anti-sigma factor RsiW) [Xaviernesmea oryzae]
MNGAERPITTDDLHAFVDGELDEARRHAVEIYLETTPDAAKAMADWRRQNEMMQALYGRIAEEDVPKRLDPHRIAAATRTGGFRWRSLAASAALLAIGIVLGWAAAPLLPSPGAQANGLVETAVEAHRLYADDMVRPVELGADQGPVLQKWLSRRLDRTLHLPDLSASGLQFIGGRLLPSGDGAAAQLMYEDEAGRRVTLYVAPSASDADSPFLHQRVKQLEAVFWGDETVRCAVVGNLPLSRLQTIAKAAYRQLI